MRSDRIQVWFQAGTGMLCANGDVEERPMIIILPAIIWVDDLTARRLFPFNI